MNNIEDIISSYLDNELTTKQEAELHQALSENENDRDMFREHIRLKQAARESLNSFTVSNELRNKLFSRLQHEEGMAQEVVQEFKQSLQNQNSQNQLVRENKSHQSESLKIQNLTNAQAANFRKQTAVKIEPIKQNSFFHNYRRTFVLMPFIVATLFGGVFMWKSFMKNDSSDFASNDTQSEVVIDGLNNNVGSQNNVASNTIPPTQTNVLSDNGISSSDVENKNKGGLVSESSVPTNSNKSSSGTTNSNLLKSEKIDLQNTTSHVKQIPNTELAGKKNNNTGFVSSELALNNSTTPKPQSVQNIGKNNHVNSELDDMKPKKLFASLSSKNEIKKYSDESKNYASTPNKNIEFASRSVKIENNMQPNLPTNNLVQNSAEQKKLDTEENYKFGADTGLQKSRVGVSLSTSELAYLLSELNTPEHDSKSELLKEKSVELEHFDNNNLQTANGFSATVSLGKKQSNKNINFNLNKISNNQDNSDFINLLVQIIKNKMQQNGMKSITTQEILKTADSVYRATNK